MFLILFQHTAARRRLGVSKMHESNDFFVSTHSRPKAAGAAAAARQPAVSVSTHSRPKAAGAQPGTWRIDMAVSTHSRPKAAGVAYAVRKHLRHWFQHTAARRRLGFGLSSFSTISSVSTHSRPKAAGGVFTVLLAIKNSFNTQPPEGGWGMDKGLCLDFVEFQHTAA